MASFSSSSTSVIIVLLLLFPILLAPPASAVPVLAACKTVGGGSSYFDVTFCLEALGSIGGGGVYRDLAAAAVGLLATNATSTEAKIGRLLGESGVKIKAGDPALVRPLWSCRSLYDGIVRRVHACTAAVKGGKFGDATAILEKAAAAAKECEDGFRESNAASPLTAEDDDAFKLTKLGVALLGFA